MRTRAAPVVLALATALLIGAGTASAAATITEYELPLKDQGPVEVVSGPDGNIWTTLSGSANAVMKTSPLGVSNEVLGFTKPTAGIAVGADGNLWVTEPAANLIARVTPAGVIKEFSLAELEGTKPTGIVAGPDGNLWFTEEGGTGAIARINPTTGKLKEYSVGLTPNLKPHAIAVGGDGALWFTETGGAGGIGRITTTGTISEYKTGLTASSAPYDIAPGPKETLWFTENANPGRIGSITAEGEIQESTAGLTADSKPTSITALGSRAYFTEAANPGRIGTITAGATITETATPASNSQPEGITRGPDGNIWFAESGNHGLIAMMTLAPLIRDIEASEVHEQTARLSAEVAPNSQATSYRFEYGKTAAYGSQTPLASAGSGASQVEVAQTVTSLNPGTVYHYRVLATNATGTTYGADHTLRTQMPPSAETASAASVTGTGATLKGAVNPNGQASTYHFEWGTSTAYGAQVPAVDASVGSGSEAQGVEDELAGLTPGVTYHFRLVASNCGGCAEGTTYGPDEQFVTAMPPSATTGAAQVLDGASATLSGEVNPNGTATTYHFQWGSTIAYGHNSPALEEAVGSDSSAHKVNATVTGLTPGVSYHFRIVATNCAGCGAGTTYGADATVTPPVVLPTAPLTPSSPVAPSGQVTPLGSGPASPPAMGRTAAAAPVWGTISVTTPGSHSWQALVGAADIPTGSLVEATNGAVLLSTALDRSGHVQSVTLWGGRFIVTQGHGRHGQTTLILAGPLACGAHAAAAGKSVAKSRKLWAHDHHGRFSTRGQNSVATVRGTLWETIDTCAGTRTIVRSGAVSVRDIHRHRTVLVRAGHSYLARH